MVALSPRHGYRSHSPEVSRRTLAKSAAPAAEPPAENSKVRRWSPGAMRTIETDGAGVAFGSADIESIPPILMVGRPRRARRRDGRDKRKRTAGGTERPPAVKKAVSCFRRAETRPFVSAVTRALCRNA